ncbi:virulence factor Mce family protein [Mycolicibacterium rhodesiae JS60]|nr:virulence factor Mce family protein [Mycolicibacterium rhodesiae JS60]
MKDNLGQAAVRLGLFVTGCSVAIFAIFMVFANLRFDPQEPYRAEFTNVTGLKSGSVVRIAGVEVGKVKAISIDRNAVAVVEFTADDTVVLDDNTRALVRYENLIGDRYLELREGTGKASRLKPGQTIGLDHTEPALDLDALIGGFRPLFRALDPGKVNALSQQLVNAFQGQGATISSFLTQAAAFTSTLADRDQLIGEVIVNLNTVLDSLGSQSKQLDETITTFAELVKGLEARHDEFVNGLSATSQATAILAGAVQDIREPLPDVIHQIDRAAGNIVADHAYFDNLLDTLPDAYQKLARFGMYGDYFSFYLCDAVLKLNGKGGQPVYVKVAAQTTGRCAPK